MKPAGLPSLFLALAGLLAAQETAPVAPIKTSTRLRQEISAALPKYTPPPPRLLDQPNDIATDPDIFALPKITVKEYRPPTHDPDVWLTDKAVQQKAMAAYQQSLTDLEWALNSWYIPILGSSPSARARGSYATQRKMSELQRVHRLFNLVSTTDPKAGSELEKERVKMEQAEYWQQRPAGHGRIK